MSEGFGASDEALAVHFVESYLSVSPALREIKFVVETLPDFQEDILLRDFYVNFSKQFPEEKNDNEDGKNLLSCFSIWKENLKKSIDAFNTKNYLTKIQRINTISRENALSFPAEELDTLLTMSPFLDKREEEEHEKKIDVWNRNFRAADKAQQMIGRQNA